MRELLPPPVMTCKEIWMGEISGAGYFLALVCFFSYLLSLFEIMRLALEDANAMAEKPGLESLRFLIWREV